MAPSSSSSQLVSWSEIDKVKFFGIGTFVYSGLTLGLHPMTVLKTRQQVLTSSNGQQVSTGRIFRDVLNNSGIRGLFRGAPIVVSVAVPARTVYISVLEISRHHSNEFLVSLVRRRNHGAVDRWSPFLASLSGGLAGGLAALSAQVLVVPMDVVSQKQMVMTDLKYGAQGSVRSVVRSVLREGGWGSLYKGFGLSIISSMPTGTVWWAVYSGAQNWMDKKLSHPDLNERWMAVLQQVIIQVFAGIAAGVVAVSQPLDVIKTKLQVGREAGGQHLTITGIVKDLNTTSGLSGFFRGLGPRIVYMSVWGTVLSSAYEMLRRVSRKED